MGAAWSAEQVLALAPDAGSTATARGLAAPGHWSQTGASDARPAVWGLCTGGGRSPYQTVVDLTGPAYRCSCPSRKVPCKHALGLLLLWSAGRVGPGDAPEWVTSWLTSREQRGAHEGRRSAEAAGKRTVDPEAAAQRARQRAARVGGGLAELDRWLTDQVRSGLAGLERAGYAHFEAVAARMIDAQAPAVAGRLRRLRGTAASGDGWPSRLLEELAMLRLTVTGHERLDTLPTDLSACVRREVGYPVAREDVLGSPPVRDHWQVLGMRDSEDERLSTRRVWLRGETTGRVAVVLSFAPSGGSLDASLVPGTTVDADLHFYPGTAPLRALVGDRHAEPGPLTTLAGGGLDDARRAFAAAVAADPWTTAWPVVVDGLTPAPAEPSWAGIDTTGRRVPLLPVPADLWRLLAVSGGRPVPVAAEFTAAGLRPFSVLAGNRLVLV